MDPSSSPATKYMCGIESIVHHSIVDWAREEAYRMGEIGFTTNFPNTSDIFRPRNIDLNAPLEPAEDESAIVKAAQTLHNKISKMKQRKATVDTNPTLLINAYDWVDDKLLAAGRRRREKDFRRLRAMVVELFELEYPPPRPNYVDVLVKPRPAMSSNLVHVSLPLKTSVADAYKLLEGAMKIESCLRDPFQPKMEVEDEGGVWKYQVAWDFTRLINKKSTRLETNSDYRRMIELITKEGSQSPLAVLTHETATRPTTESTVSNSKDDKAKPEGAASGNNDHEESKEAEDTDDGTYPEPLDEDGNPYFVPVIEEDWARVYKAYNKKYEATMDVDG